MALLDGLVSMIHPARAWLARPTLAALACLTAPPFNATAMLMTATQPAFTHLSPNVEELCGHVWAPSETVAAPRRLFSLIRRTKFVWPAEGQFTGWRELADELSHLDPRQALVVVNLKRHTQTLLQFVPGSPGVFHLSTALCPAHRRTILEAVRDRLKRHTECMVISTQCVGRVSIWISRGCTARWDRSKPLPMRPGAAIVTVGRNQER